MRKAFQESKRLCQCSYQSIKDFCWSVTTCLLQRFDRHLCGRLHPEQAARILLLNLENQYGQM
jgi:hypothetical protein